MPGRVSRTCRRPAISEDSTGSVGRTTLFIDIREQTVKTRFFIQITRLQVVGHFILLTLVSWPAAEGRRSVIWPGGIFQAHSSLVHMARGPSIVRFLDSALPV